MTGHGTNIWVPAYEACRVLVARNVRGRLEVWRIAKSSADVIVPDIAKAAEWTIEENEKSRPRRERWRLRPQNIARNAASLSGGASLAADFPRGGESAIAANARGLSDE